jgi:uncharacterized protein YcbX
MDIRLKAIQTALIKSTHMRERDTAFIGVGGAHYDRMLCVAGAEWEFLSQRSHPHLALIHSRLDMSDDVTVTVPNCEERLTFKLSEMERCPKMINLHDDERISLDDAGNEAADYLSSYLGERCRLMALVRTHRFTEDARTELYLQDGAPLSVLSRESVTELNRILMNPVPESQFRMTFLIEDKEGHLEPNFEDRIARARIGPVELRFQRHTKRCKMVNVNQETAATDPTVFRALASYRMFQHHGKGKVWFGDYFNHEGFGFVSVGMPVEVLEWQDPPRSER